MIDTVNIFYPHAIHTQQPMPGWNYGTRLIMPGTEVNHGHGQQQSFTCDDSGTGYHGYGSSFEIRHHRVSLPRLLHGSNGYLIKSQVELEAALVLLIEKAGELGNPSVPDYHFTRVDLVWQFAGDTADYIQAHRSARHPRIRKDSAIYEGRSLAFNGSEMRICIYDKVKKQTRRNGNIVRVEIQLTGGRLIEELGDGNRVTSLSFGACYTAYRRILLGFTPSAVPRASGIAELLAIGERSGWQAGGASAFEIYTAGMSSRQIRRIQHDMASLRPTVHNIDWAQLLPADAPPAPLELLSPATCTPIGG